MWIWWMVSLVILITCFIFTYRMMVSSYEFLPTDKKFLMGFKKNYISDKSLLQEYLRNLKSKIQSVEDTTSYYEIQFSKFQQRLKALEELCNHKQPEIAHAPKASEEEDWKEMYYQENEAKEKIENELDEVRQKLEEAQNNIEEFEKNKSEWSVLQSNYDARLNDLQSMQNNIELLQRQLEAAADREKEMEQLLLVEINFKKQYAQLETEHARLKSENEDIKRQLIEMNKREAEMEQHIVRAKELESRIAIYEEEKLKMISDLEQMVNQNKMFLPPKNS
jgi:predicted  nucleic acid-binding Zn-ribbon protein